MKFGSVELAEARFPLHFDKHEFRRDSAGDGQFRGGAGVDLELTVETEKPALANTAGDGIKYGSRGMVGGEDSKPHAYSLLKLDGTERKLKTKEISVDVDPGDKFIIRSAGGGGWGNPTNRSSEARALDYKNEITSEDRA